MPNGIKPCNELVKKSDDNLPVIFKYRMEDVNFDIPSAFDGADKRTLSSILNACKGSFSDENTDIYFESNCIHTILRTKEYIARRYILELEQDERINYGDKIYVSLPAIMKLVSKRMSSLGVGKTRDYLSFCEACLIRLRDNDKFINLRTKLEKDWKDEVNKLKNQRIKKYKINIDELTGDKLVSNSQFSHIRSKAAYRNYALDINNGLIVNDVTHVLITSRKIIDEEGLLDLCKEMNWRTNWYSIFKNLVQ